MTYRKTMLSASIVAALMFTGVATAHDSQPVKNQSAQPQNTTQQSKSQQDQSTTNGEKNAQNLKGIVVTGIRASLQKSLQTERNANAVVTAVTAEDIGKFPNTNVAEAMALMPGVTIDRLFGEGGRVSIDGTDPGLNLTLLDGHPVAQVGAFIGAPGDKGFDYQIIAPQMVDRIEIYKTSEARLPSGSLGGTVFIHTREPLNVPSGTFTAQVGGLENSQAGKWTPRASAFTSWKNANDTFGIDVGFSHFDEKIDRSGMEVFGQYSPVSALLHASIKNDATGVTTRTTNIALQREIASGKIRATDELPQEVNAAYFQQNRKRNSLITNIEFRPSDHLNFTLSGMFIRENFDNYNSSLYGVANQIGGNVSSLVRNNAGIITSGQVCGAGDPNNSIFTQFSDAANPGSGNFTTNVTPTTCPGATVNDDYAVRLAKVYTSDIHLKGSYTQTNWGISGQIGISKAHNNSTQIFMEAKYGGGYAFDLGNGMRFEDPQAALNPHNWGSLNDTSVLILRNQTSVPYGKVNFHLNFKNNFINQLLFGVRLVENRVDSLGHGYAGGVNNGTLADLGNVGLTDILDSGTFSGWSVDQRHHLQPSAGAIRRWVRGSATTNVRTFDSQYNLASTYISQNSWFRHKTEAGYVQLNFGNLDWRGNIGARFVRNRILSKAFRAGGQAPSFPIPQSWLTTKSHTVTNVLPAANLVYDNGGAFVFRLAAAEVIAWPLQGQLIDSQNINNLPLLASGGNPDLDPYKSINSSAAVDWYFAPQSALTLTVFNDHILNYISTVVEPFKTFNANFHTQPKVYQQHEAAGLCDNRGFCTYQLTTPASIGGGRLLGYSLAYQQPYGDTGFGMVSSFTYADGTTKIGYGLPFSSKDAVKFSPYYERGPLSARVTYNWRSSYQVGGYSAGQRPATAHAYIELDASIGWQFNKHWSLRLAALNLRNEAYFTYQDTPNEPITKYTNGRRYMLTLRFRR